MINRNKLIEKQKDLRCDCIYNIENTALEIGISGKYLHLLSYFDTHICSSPTRSFMPYASTFLFVWFDSLHPRFMSGLVFLGLTSTQQRILLFEIEWYYPGFYIE